ncbi:glycoside hydrolase family 140 protein [Tuwongella immobilis]|uniref:DUF4038 domain-containing protein n=1 Tax=Tuwongella immobilis TaxID=692036 RepID=A0A6C2YJU1_9BACT|nr:glycoside hydrolase family 140 protein [Tuwongella immobilis]VIP01686.1 hypothetical protein : Uncharacterized protein OS=Opitutus terrae (strain DSM 11246 / PB90-1) GN=Oter_3064 PE=4 SV=1: DUF4038: Collagen_bind_2 [Tuwongella immobilis]VTR99146.1 hypothetical protein : Uncharacterized protein OS=Opitutus terrae (strain DSM 11246 / PB90-1) GN=Oter_3064 PE=4 SV=1: DUF4038: Collagen_bind_2 [Tuwongella immobilis]
MRIGLTLGLGLWLLASPLLAQSPLPRLQVSENRRFLVTESGKPFFYLGDTAWELIHRVNRSDIDLYLSDRERKGFTVIQTVILAELDGLRVPNPRGHLPLQEMDPARPNEPYFEDVDYVVQGANRRGMYVGLLPTWGDKVGPKAWGVGPEIFTPAKAAQYGEFLGKRYRDAGVIWILGGDRNPVTPEQKEIWRTMAKGIRQGSGGKQLITFHPQGGGSSATFFFGEDWIDFHMQQNGHDTDTPVWERIARDYQRRPHAPVMDAEPLYEDHPIGFKPDERGHSNAADIRKFAYRDVFSGAFGHTYGNHAIWQAYDGQREPVNRPLSPWKFALQAPGAEQMQYLRRLMESRPMLERIPDDSLILRGQGAGGKRVVATRDSQGRYAMIYLPTRRRITVDTKAILGKTLQQWWMDPRTGEVHSIGTIPNRGQLEWIPPWEGENLDAVLILDDADQGYSPPGSRRK